MSETRKYIMFKYMPYKFKNLSDIESFSFDYSYENKYSYGNHTNYKMIGAAPVLEMSDKNMFRYMHFEGAHVPLKNDKNFNPVNPGTYEQKIEAVITMLSAYIKRLKENGVYDNSVIIIMGDHGTTEINGAEDMLKRANPMLMIKGFDEHHALTENDKPISFLDLAAAYNKLLDGKTAEETFADIPDERERTFIWYNNFRHEDHKVEYSVKGKARDWQDFVPTGNEYDL